MIFLIDLNKFSTQNFKNFSKIAKAVKMLD